MKSSVFILNSCTLGANEVEFWNSIFDRYQENYHFHFFSTSAHEDLRADEMVDVVYGVNVVEEAPAACSSSLRQLIHRVSEKDRIWEEYEENRSPVVAYSWVLFWTIAIRSFFPAKVIIWNGHHIPEAALAEVCRLEGIETLFAERGPLVGTFTLDPDGTNCLSRFYRHFANISLPTADCRLNEFSDIYFSAGLSNWGQPKRNARADFISALGLPKNKIILFFPTQVDRDTNSKLFSPHFSSTRETLTSLVKWCNDHSEEVFLLVKKHPMHEGDYSFEDVEIKSGAFIENAHIFDCIQYCDGIVSVNSSAAIEGALMGKPVLLLGNSLLDYWDQVHKLHHQNELDTTLRSFVDACRVGTTLPNSDYFCRLIFGYLYTAKSEYLALGMKTPELKASPRSCEPTAASEVLQQNVSALDALIPNHQSLIFQTIQNKKEVNRLKAQVNSYRNNIFIKIFNKLGLLAQPVSE